MVPADRALKLRMSLAEEGQPVGSTVGYELLDKAGPFGTSEFQANINLRRAIEGELARSIGTLRKVLLGAHPHKPAEAPKLFARDAAPPTASIRPWAFCGGATLEKSQIAGINDRVGRQACFQAVPVRSMALRITTSLRTQAVSASLAGFPAVRSRP